jgi:DNA-binding IclR family transcriptional regulator
MEHLTFITNHGAVLICIARRKQAKAVDIAEALGITEWSVRRITGDLETGGYISKARSGRVNRYKINPKLPLRRPESRDITVGELLKTLKL